MAQEGGCYACGKVLIVRTPHSAWIVILPSLASSLSGWHAIFLDIWQRRCPGIRELVGGGEHFTLDAASRIDDEQRGGESWVDDRG